MKNSIKHVCFDKDGTLIDVHASWVPMTRRRVTKIIDFYRLDGECRDALALAMGVDLQTQRIIPGGPVGYQPRAIILQAVAQWLGHQKVDASIEQLAEIFRGVDSDVQVANDFNANPLPGVVDGIKRLKQSGIKLSLYTSDRHKNAQRVLDLLGLEENFDIIIGGDDVIKPKPDPEGFIKACGAVNISVADSIYVGDTADDMLMARQCFPNSSYGVAQGLSSYEELKHHTPTVFKNFNDLMDHLLK